jgi:hypothetical protein
MGAGLVLALCEVNRRPNRLGIRMAYRLALMAVAVLALATGFFGGAVVYGFDHYRWPQ